MPNSLDDRTENENDGDGSTDNSNGAVTTFNTVQNMEMQAVNLDDSVGLPGVVPNETRLVKSPRQQNLGEVPDPVDNSLGEQPVNTDSTAN